VSRLVVETKDRRNESEGAPRARRGGKRGPGAGRAAAPLFALAEEGRKAEPPRWDPKDGDLCLDRVKPGEILVEAHSDTDVQIVRRIWV